MRLGALEVVAVALAVGTGGGLALEGGAEGNELVVNRAVVVVVVIGDGPHAALGHAKEAELWRTAVGREEEAGLLQSLAQVAPKDAGINDRGRGLGHVRRHPVVRELAGGR